MFNEIVAWLKEIAKAIGNISTCGCNVQSDWAESDNTKPAFIKNKPSIPAAQVQADWKQANNEAVDFIKNKPAVITKVEVENIGDIPGEVLDALGAGDIVVKVDSTGKHAYTVSYLGEGGLCLTYADCQNVETVAYNKSAQGVWSFDDITSTHIGQ